MESQTAIAARPNEASLDRERLDEAGRGMPGLEPSSASGSESQAEQRTDRRQFLRYPVDCSARMVILSGAMAIEGRISDLSLGGCRMVTPEPVSLGILARVEISFELRGYAFRMVGVTAGTRAKKSFGLRFLEMPARRAEALTELLEEIQRSPEGPRTGGKQSMLPPMEQAAAEKRLATKKLSVEKLVREKQAGGAAAEGVGEAGAGKPADRRTHRRHGVDTRVNLTLIRGAITMPGQILNLSQGGCKLRTDEHFNVGIYTRVEAEFFLHGLPFRLAGVSQAILDKNTIGVRFLDMSERKREQLTELIAEIEEFEGIGNS